MVSHVSVERNDVFYSAVIKAETTYSVFTCLNVSLKKVYCHIKTESCFYIYLLESCGYSFNCEIVIKK